MSIKKRAVRRGASSSRRKSDSPGHVREAKQIELLRWLLDFQNGEGGDEDEIRRQLEELHRTNVGGVLAVGRGQSIAIGGIRRFRNWSRDLLKRVLQHSNDSIDDIRLPPVTPVLRVYWRVERWDLARWPNTLRLRTAALIGQFKDRISVCNAWKEREQRRCGKLFVRVRRQQYCSSECAQRERSRRWYRDNRKKT